MGDTKDGDVPGQKISDNATIVPDFKDDGYMTVTFSKNDLEAWADFFPPQDRGSPISDAYIQKLLQKLSITFGIQWDNINEACTTSAIERKPLRNILIAKGIPPVNEVLEYYSLNPHIGKMDIPEDPKARIDYRSISPYIIVKQNQVLAQKHPKIEGREGKNIHGEEMPYRTIRNEGVTGGEKTRTDEKYIYSTINGQLITTKNVLDIKDSLVIKGPVGYATGNIIFPGDVTIDGPVSDGFKIFTGGSVLIKQTFDVTEASTKGDLVVQGGIIGRGRAIVKVGGGMKTKFIQNCRVACRKAIVVDTDIINSMVYTMESLEIGEKGTILGGEIYAIQGIKAGNIGRRVGKHTQIHCGVDFTIQQEKEKCNNQLQSIAEKLAKVRELLADPASADDKATLSKTQDYLRRLEQEQEKTTARLTSLLSQMITYDQASVEVSGEIAPGTLIEICQIALYIGEPLRKVRIRLEAPSGKLISEPL